VTTDQKRNKKIIKKKKIEKHEKDITGIPRIKSLLYPLSL
jgi:hypothetical protein